MHIYYSSGFGEGGSDGRIEVQKFLEAQRTNPDPESRIHAIWYFHDCSKEGVPDSEEDLLKMDFGDIPVLVILQKEDDLLSKFKQPEKISDINASLGDLKVDDLFAMAINSIQGQLQLPQAGKYVHMPGMGKYSTVKSISSSFPLSF